ncbi:protein HAPLESS 2 isoform X2 [Cryptomeria japonica]|uniref:protein HAPLESS 2 isoform X2 n=1 Tax=Cryptomeria japonica TaxID=3369 RepID=UPI0027DA3B8B|nr:protein HAPLESS 2 isoform X2 [Cryptomeria japonica]
MEGGEEHRSIVMNRGKTRRKPPKIKWPNALLLVIMAMVFNWCSCMTVLSKSKLTKCERTSDADLSCQQKLILNIAVPSGSRGDADSVDVLLEKAEDTLTGKVRVFDEPPKIRVSKSPAFALYALHYLKDVNSEPKEIIVETRKCEEDSDKTVGTCKRLRDKNGKPIDITQPKCCPCGSKSRWPYHKCGSRMGIIERIKGKRNTAHCLRFVGSWFHVFEVGRRQIGFNVKIEVSQGDEKLIIINVNPQNKRAVSNDNFLKANLIGDFSGYRSVPSFDNMYLSIPAQNLGKPKKLGNDFMKWMLIERTRYTLDGTECDKIGVDFVGFSNQPSFCSAPLGTCIQQQLINYLQFDTARVDRNQIPEYLVGRRFSRINQHPGAGPNSFSIGILEPLNSRIILEIKADDIRFTVNKSPGKITAIFIPHFEALSQFGNASIFTINTGELEASYSLHFSCQEGVNPMLDQQYSMKPTEVVACMFEVIINKANTSTFNCTAILKNSGFEEVDRQDTWFTIDNVAYNTGNQIYGVPSANTVEENEGFLGLGIEKSWQWFKEKITDFFTGRKCMMNCRQIFDFKCHFKYLCIIWIFKFILLIILILVVIYLLWLLYQNKCIVYIFHLCRRHKNQNAHSITNGDPSKKNPLIAKKLNLSNKQNHGHSKHYHKNRNGRFNKALNIEITRDPKEVKKHQTHSKHKHTNNLEHKKNKKERNTKKDSRELHVRKRRKIMN